MKHLIIAKFKKDFDYEDRITDIKSIFEELLNIDGIHNVNVYPKCIFRENRYDLMIEIEMEKEVLPTYDSSAPHKKWIQNYAEHVELKTIFDYE